MSCRRFSKGFHAENKIDSGHIDYSREPPPSANKMALRTEKNCSSCNAVFTCGPAQSGERCWCEHLPHVPLIANERADCLCPQCLNAAISKINVESQSVAGENNRACLPELREGEDYYVDGAAIVFTARYHLRRGYCCESGCRHCPYETMSNEALTLCDVETPPA